MGNIFDKIKFKYTFRDYQKRALVDINRYIKDNKVNIIAAPGAGKTVLALQIMIELKAPTLILAPTIALREQWIDRLKNDFECKIDINQYISDDIFNPNIVTVTTYQSLYSVYKKKSEKSENINIIELLNKIGVKTILLDEAHHLKTAWLEATQDVVNKMQNVKIISLTATPPYDTDKLLWNKYVELCGNPDVEVTVAELVKRGDLAPHQDYIYLNNLDDNQIKEINQYREKIDEFLKRLLNNTEFITSLATANIIVDSEGNKEYIIENFQYYIALLKLLRIKGIEIKQNDNVNLGKNILSIEDIEMILTYALFKDKKSYDSFTWLYREIKRELNELGVIDESRVNLKYTKDISDLITQNAGKIYSIKAILKNEKAIMKEKLKTVIITENIREDALDIEEDKIKFIGVIPIFKSLMQEYKPIVLTGEIIIIPIYLKELFFKICEEEGIEEENISVCEMAIDFNYATVSFSASKKKKAVGVITKLFEKSDANLLIGTNALIGEGWDAPFINTLIVANSIAAYVTSNQVRGRAIRTDKTYKEKCANIWHLISVEKKGRDSFILGKDYEMLERRFEGFEGVNIDTNKISYGINRLNLKEKLYKDNELDALNKNMLESALNRANTIKKWNEALENYTPMRKNRLENKDITPFLNSENKTIHTIYKSLRKEECSFSVYTSIYKNSYSYMINPISSFIGAIAGISVFISFCLEQLKNFDYGEYGIAVIIGGVLGLVTGGVSKALIKAIANKIADMLVYDADDFIEIIQRLLNTLKYTKMVNCFAELIFDKSDSSFYLDKADLKENTMFKQAVKELLGPIDNPRYIITDGNQVYQVPTVLGRNKANVQILYCNIFRKRKMAVIFTRTPVGKDLLLKLKMLQVELLHKEVVIGNSVNNLINEAAKNISNEEIDISIDVMQDVLKSKNLLQEEEK